jgi:hypothetical protein
MFVDKPVGGSLERKQLKWLLVALGTIMVVALLLLSFKLMNDPATDPAQPISGKSDMQSKPTEDEIRMQLEALAKEDAENPAPKPTEEEIRMQLEALVKEDAENPAPKPTEEEIRKQLEMLSKQ